MVVRTNVFALNAHRNLTNTGLQQRQAAQRLSSGFRVNSAADDAAGLAISESMRAQIRGLDQASINAQDGVGLIQTAEGAMATISDMVIRVRELMVQAANDTNTFKNREMIQEEIDQIMTEINDVTFRTQFNTRTLLAGGLGGEGGGPSSPVSLEWMVFDQARVIGNSQPGGVVGPGRMPSVHDNPNNRNQTSLRNSVIELQTEMQELARRVADRKVADPNINFTADDRSAVFSNINTLDFSGLLMLPAERTELQGIANRLESLMRNGLRAAEDLFQTTQDQINALGGQGSINNDGSSVFSGPAIGTWNLEARTLLQEVRDSTENAMNAINNAMNQPIGRALEEMNLVLRDIVGNMNGSLSSDLNMSAASIGFPFPSAQAAATGFTVAAADIDFNFASAAAARAGGLAHNTQIAPGIFLIHGPGATASFATMRDANTTMAPPIGPSGFGVNFDGTNFTLSFSHGQQVAAVSGMPGPTNVFLVNDGSGNWSFNTAANGSGANVRMVGGTFIVPDEGTGTPNSSLDELERLLDLSRDVLGNVMLESNAMWFQIGANTMQGMVLQLKGIHTGILGGGSRDLAMLIDVREGSGVPISEQLKFIDAAEGIVNGQRAQLGAIQNRLEFTRQSLDVSSENLSAAESRIRDTDMAREMMRFTQAQVLQQAGISMLAQANQLPSSILQLLQ